MSTGQKRVAMYVRVSTAQKQTTLNQQIELEDVCRRNDWEIVEVYGRNNLWNKINRRSERTETNVKRRIIKIL